MTKHTHSVKHATAQQTLEQVDSATAATLSELSTTEAEPQLAPVAQDALVITFIVGTDGNDILLGDTNDNVIRGLGGNDQINGDYGNDFLYGGAGDDFLVGGHDNDRLVGGAGADLLAGGDGIDTVTYEDAHSEVDGRSGVVVSLVDPSVNRGDAVGDVFIEVEIFRLSIFNDAFVGAGGDDVVYGESGTDFLDGGAGNDQLNGGAGTDVLSGQDGNDILVGGQEDDRLDGGAGADTLVGDDGNDTFYGGAGADILTGGDGIDTAIYLFARAAVSIDLTRASSTWTSDAQGDVLSSIEQFVLTPFNDLLIGNA